jgi:iron complex outermembrane receptor protein
MSIPFTNTGTIKVRGGELELDGRWPNGLTARGSFSLQRAVDDRTDTELPNSPRTLAKLALGVPLPLPGLVLGLEELYTGSRRTLEGGSLDPFWLTNLTLWSTGLLPRLELSFSVYNLFDQHFSVPGAGEHLLGGISSIEQDGRIWRGKLTCRF